MTMWTLSSISADWRRWLHSCTVAVDDVATKATTTTDRSDAVVAILFPVGDRRPPYDDMTVGDITVDAGVRHDNDIGRSKLIVVPCVVEIDDKPETAIGLVCDVGIFHLPMFTTSLLCRFNRRWKLLFVNGRLPFGWWFTSDVCKQKLWIQNNSECSQTVKLNDSAPMAYRETVFDELQLIQQCKFWLKINDMRKQNADESKPAVRNMKSYTGGRLIFLVLQ